MGPDTLPEAIGRRFHRPPVPSVLACSELRRPIVFSHISSAFAMPSPTLAPPVEDAFAVHLHHTPVKRAEVWLQGRHASSAGLREGSVAIFDLRSEPTAFVDEPFAFSRFYVHRSAIGELADEHGIGKVGDLRPLIGPTDLVLEHLSLALLKRRLLFGNEADHLFQDAIARAFFVHVVSTYAGVTLPSRHAEGLAAMKLRRLADWVDAQMHQPITTSAMAAIVGLSPSYFSRALARATGHPPHRWLLARRIARAKVMLRATDLPIEQIAFACGFVDQSHFTKVFARLVRETPARWRRSGR